MYSIISTLDPEADSKVNQLRAWLIDRNPSLGNTLLLDPHVSWLGAEEMDVRTVGEMLTRMAHTLSPLYLVTTGFGVFSGRNPVLYLPIVKTTELAKLHASLWDLLSSEVKVSNLMFRPEQWLPHITVLYLGEQENESLGRTMADLIKMEFYLHFTIDHFRIAYIEGDHYGQKSVHRFNG